MRYDEETVHLRLRTKRGDVEEAVLIAGDKSSGI
ncbi:alpha amylase N-terminal ig-like domain-containing protein [Paenibacillus sp. EPM92]